MKAASKRIAYGIYLYKDLYISVYEGNIQRVWNIYSDSDLLDEFAVGFNTKKEAMEYIDKSIKK
jgi:hypothetical protein